MVGTDESVAGFFESLEQRAAKLSPAVDMGFKRDLWLLAMLGVGLLLGVVLVLPGVAGVAKLLVAIGSIVLQSIGVTLLFYRQVRDAVPDFIDANRKYAVEMDSHFEKREALLVWLRSFPAATRRKRLEYVESRLENLRSRYPMIFGAIEKLGVLPALIGVFIQYQAFKTFSVVTMVLGIWIVALFAMAMWTSRFRLQLEGHARLLRAADAPPDADGPIGTSESAPAVGGGDRT